VQRYWSPAVQAVVVGAFTAGAALLLLYFIIPNYVRDPRTVGGGLPPSFFPRMTTILVAAFGVVELLRGLKEIFFSNGPSLSKEVEKDAEQISPWPVALLAGVFFVYSYTLGHFGFIGPSMLLMALLFWLFGLRRWWMIVLLAIGVPLGFWLLFERLLRMVLP
jgi:hypothetical protein